MTTPSPSLDLHTLNAVETALVQALRNQVCDWEQAALDASREGHHAVADTYTKWAFATELCAYKVGTTVGTLFSDTLRSFEQSVSPFEDAFRGAPHSKVQDERVVQLPDLSKAERPGKDLTTTAAAVVTAD